MNFIWGKARRRPAAYNHRADLKLLVERVTTVLRVASSRRGIGVCRGGEAFRPAVGTV
jgi:hypothetical protein